MPKSKRQKVISLTKVVKKGKGVKAERFQKIQDACLQYRYIYLISPQNMRAREFKRLHETLAGTKVCIGKTKLMACALKAVAQRACLDPLLPRLRGLVGLLFSDLPADELQDQLQTLVGPVFARSGNMAPRTVTLESGPLLRHGEPIPGTLAPTLRKLGLTSTTLVRGQLTLSSPHTLCTQNTVLTPNQAHLLKHFDIQLSEFRVVVKCYVDTETGEFHELSSEDTEMCEE